MCCGQSFCPFTCCRGENRQRLHDDQEAEKPPTPVQYTFVDVEDDPNESEENTNKPNEGKADPSHYPSTPATPSAPYRGVFPSSIPHQGSMPMYSSPVSTFPSNVPPAHYALSSAALSQPEPQPFGHSPYLNRTDLPPLPSLPYPQQSATPSASSVYSRSTMWQPRPLANSSTRFPVMPPQQEQQEPQPSATPPPVLRPGLKKFSKSPTAQSSPLSGQVPQSRRPSVPNSVNPDVMEGYVGAAANNAGNAERPLSKEINFSRPALRAQTPGTQSDSSLPDKEINEAANAPFESLQLLPLVPGRESEADGSKPGLNSRS